MNNIIDTNGRPVDADDYEIVKPWFWETSGFLKFAAVTLCAFALMFLVAETFHLILKIYSTDKRMDILLTETSVQLQTIADGCLNKGGE